MAALQNIGIVDGSLLWSSVLRLVCNQHVIEQNFIYNISRDSLTFLCDPQIKLGEVCISAITPTVLRKIRRNSFAHNRSGSCGFSKYIYFSLKISVIQGK